MSQPYNPQQPTYGDPRDARARAKAEKAYRKAQRPWYRKKRVLFPLGFVLLLVLISALSSGGESGAPATSRPAGATPAAQEPAAPPAFPGATENDLVAQAGEAVTADGITMTSTKLVKGSSTFESTLCTTVTYQNGSDKPTSFNGGFDWKLQDPNGAILMNTFAGSDKRLNSGELAPGGKTTGEVCFKAPDGSPSGLYIVLLDPSFRFSSDRIAWLNKR